MFGTTKPSVPSLDAIADMVLGMTYGEMIELAGAIKGKLATNDDMAKALYDWAKGHRGPKDAPQEFGQKVAGMLSGEAKP